MSDFDNVRAASDDDSADFEGHRLGGPEKHGKHGDIADVRSAGDDGADFEGHRMAGPEKIAKLGDITDVKA